MAEKLVYTGKKIAKADGIKATPGASFKGPKFGGATAAWNKGEGQKESLLK